MNIIEVKNVVKYYGNFLALKGVSFSIKEGLIVGLLGPNGAGKTTLMRIITGYLPATTGEAYINGYEVHENPIEVRRSIGYLPEDPPLYPDMRVNEYLRFVGLIKGVPASQIKERVDEVVEMVGLQPKYRALIKTLSRGYRQRVGLAQALIHDPPILILDEPTVGLDPNQIIEIRNLLLSFQGRKTIIFSTHILQEVVLTCEKVIVISEGEIVADEYLDKLIPAITSRTFAEAKEMSSTLEKAFLDIINKHIKKTSTSEAKEKETTTPEDKTKTSEKEA